MTVSLIKLLVAKPVEPSLYLLSKSKFRERLEQYSATDIITNTKHTSSEFQHRWKGQNIQISRSKVNIKHNLLLQTPDESAAKSANGRDAKETHFGHHDLRDLSESPLFSEWSKETLLQL